MKTKTFISTLVLVACLLCSLGAKAAEAYACYTSSNTTLTFYYDNLRSSRSGETFDMNSGTDWPDWRSHNPDVECVDFNPSFAYYAPTSTTGWFFQMTNLWKITGLEYLNTSNVTTMVLMFYNCTSLMTLNLSHFNTSQVVDMSEMFYGCGSLRKIYVGVNWTTDRVQTADYMFYDCNSLVGEMGTTYNENKTGKEYAHIDGGPSNPGYFTEKPGWSRGDVNGDGLVGIADVTSLIDLLLEGGELPAVADVNEDGVIGIADATALIDYLLIGTWQ